MCNTITQSPRLYLRQLTPQDAENFYRLNLDHHVMRYTGDVPFSTVEAAQTFLAHYDQYKKYGYGRWAVIRQSDDAFLGWCRLKYAPELEETDIGFRFFREFWNQGYATEAANLCLKLGFEQFGLKRIVGRAMSENVASIKVLEKIGLKTFENSKCDAVCDRSFEIFSE
jgi:RimJ/RimL family protein N-acetyltransferase